MLQAGFKPSTYHADKIPGESRPVIDWERGIYANDDLIVLKTAKSKAILIEAGVIVNPIEEAYLLKSSTVSLQAKLISRALYDCIK